MPTSKRALLFPSSLTFFLTIPQATKSVIKTTSVTNHATEEMSAAHREPKMEAPSEARKARNARPHATGWRTMTRVSASAVFLEAEP